MREVIYGLLQFGESSDLDPKNTADIKVSNGGDALLIVADVENRGRDRPVTIRIEWPDAIHFASMVSEAASKAADWHKEYMELE